MLQCKSFPHNIQQAMGSRFQHDTLYSDDVAPI